jgi:cobalt-zinc-cadmium resistance protein CzcA
MDSALQEIPGLGYAFTQPIQMRLDEAESGITTDVGVKIVGTDPTRWRSSLGGWSGCSRACAGRARCAPRRRRG